MLDLFLHRGKSIVRYNLHQLPALQDNYIYILECLATKTTAVIDPSCANVVSDFLKRKPLDFILNTHHHIDHVGGNLELKKKYQATVIASKYDENRIPGLDKTTQEGDVVKVGELEANVFEVPGHTLGHIVYWFKEIGVAFVGDTLFAMGCGRLFEGSPEQMWHSLKKIRALPKDTLICTAHEYTVNNAAFALSLDPDNQKLHQRMEAVKKLQEQNKPTVPYRLSEDLETNPFLRADDKTFIKRIFEKELSDVDAFVEMRERKDIF